MARRRTGDVAVRAAEGIALLTAVVSTDGGLLRAAVRRRGAPGIVVEATGAGNTDPDLLAAALEAMALGIPVVLTTRCRVGRGRARSTVSRAAVAPGWMPVPSWRAR